MQKKRWYQLSMLQLLVAMAIVALFVVKNYSLHCMVGEQRYPSSLAPNLYFRGWPLTYWRAVGFSSQEPDALVGFPAYDWISLASNVACCAGAVLAAIWMVSLFILITDRAMPNVAAKP